MAKYRWVSRMIEVIEHTYEFETDSPTKSSAESHIYEMGGVPIGESEQEVISCAIKIEPAPGFEPTDADDEVVEVKPDEPFDAQKFVKGYMEREHPTPPVV